MNQTRSFTYHDPARRGTVVGLLTPDGQLRLGMAVKNEKDTFNRKLGRRIALGRAEKNPWKVVNEFGVDDGHRFYNTAAIALNERLTEIPQR